MPHLYLVDGSGYIFRAYHRLPPLTNKHGEPVGAVYGYTAMLWKLADELHAHAYSAFPPSFFSSLATFVSTSVFPRSPTAHPLKPFASPAPLTAPPLSPAASTSSRTLPKLTLSPLHLLYLLSPLAFIQTTLLAHFTGELARVRWHLFSGAGVGGAAGATGRVWLLFNGALAFFLNVVSFNANRRVGPLGMSVAGECCFCRH